MYKSEATLIPGAPGTLTQRKQLVLASVICILAASFYMYEFILQVSPAVMTTELMRDLHLNAAALGTVAAFYYYSYTPMQIPAGMLYDRFGPRRLLTLAVLTCTVGALLFAIASSIVMASAGRFFMGIGSSFSFIGALLLVSRWFPPQRFALLTGLVQLMSSLGAIMGQVPLAAATEHWGWRPTLIGLAILGLFLQLLTWIIVRDSPEIISQGRKCQPPPKSGELKCLLRVCSNRQTWLLALYSFTTWAPITAFAALWGVPFLVNSYGIGTEAASGACAMIWLGIGIGSPLLGWLSDKIRSRSTPLSITALLGVVSLSIVIYVPQLPMTVVYITLFLFGVAASGQALSFGVVKDNNPPSIIGTAIGFNNMAVVAGGALFQPLIGLLLDYHWHGPLHECARLYGVVEYRKAFLVLPICYLTAWMISQFFLRETHCRPQFSADPSGISRAS